MHAWISLHYCVCACLCILVYLCSLLKSLVKNQFKEDFSSVFKHLSASSAPTEDDMRSLLFGDYMKPDAVSRELTSIAHTYNSTLHYLLPNVEY